MTTRGFGTAEARQIANLMADVLEAPRRRGRDRARRRRGHRAVPAVPGLRRSTAALNAFPVTVSPFLFPQSFRRLHMAGRNGLFVPGPTNVPDRVLRAMVVSMEDHRSPKFPALTLECLAGLKKVFKTRHGHALHLPVVGHRLLGSGADQLPEPGRQGADRALRPVLAPVDRHVPAPRLRGRGARRANGVRARRSTATSMRSRPTRAARIKAVLATHNETATGVTSDVAGVRKAMDAVGHPALLFVDAVSSLGIDRLPHGRVGRRRLRQRLAEGPDAAGRPGHRLRASEKALEARRDTATAPRCYFDFVDMLKARTRPATSRTRRRCRCCTACAKR